ncbi:MAG: G8 domain-containing protein [Meiothermus ruber]|jgi:cell migration-inducing and hyaluronan-binding protein|uniref:G8 domain-containing protein n=1 Tax=Meiothermus ruber TaxID=277 RepID=UPI0039191E5E
MKQWLGLFLIAFLVACNTDGVGVSPPNGPNPSRTGLWSDPKTWPSGQLPRAGEVVVIPADLAVVLDVSPPPLKGLTINGVLRFDNRDLELSADWIMVHGKLEVGTPNQPFRNRAIIALTGNNPDEDQMGMGTKVLGVMGGILDLHGEPRKGWTKLAQTAPVGATQITVLDASGWRAGDRIVLASTDYNPRQAEVRTIQAVNGNTITLDAPLRYPHFGEITYGVDQRGEVGLLSRNILIRGDDSSISTGFGGHIMAMMGSTMRVSGVELYRMGQRNLLARYPIHWHLMGRAPGQYIKNSSIHESFNRCVTIHGTSEVEVSGNVAYNTLGHCYFLEDGAETKNLIEGNLGILTREPDPAKGEEGVIPTDKTPATFWISHPDNIVRNNVAAGSDHTGFWYALPENPTGPSATTTIWPRRTPLGEFSGNVAHSNWDGLMVDRGPNKDTLKAEPTVYNPRTNPSNLSNNNTENPPVVAEFKNFTAYKNRGNAAWLRGINHKVTGAKLADNAIGMTFASQESTLEDSLIVGDSNNKGFPENWEFRGVDGRSLPRSWPVSAGGPIADNFPIRGFEFYDGKVGFRNVHFINFQPLQIQNAQGSHTAIREAGALSYLRFTAFAIDSRNFAEGARFTNAKPVYLPPRPEPTPEEIAEDKNADGYRGAVFVDIDGSVGGHPGHAIVLNTPFLLDTNCQIRADWNAGVCNYSYGRLYIYNESGGNIAPVSLTRNDGGNPVFRMWGAPRDGDNSNFAATVIKGRNYTLGVNGVIPNKLKLRFDDSVSGEFIYVAIPYSGEPFIYRDYWIDNRNKLVRAVSRAEFDGSTGDRYWSEGGMLFVKLVVRDQPGRDWAVLDICRSDLCR